MIKPVLVALICFVLFFTIHVIRFHFFHPKEKAQSVLNTYYFTALFAVGLYFWLPPMSEIKTPWISDEVWGLCYALSILVTLFLGYINFYFTADRSITFRMLMLIEESPQKQLTEQQMIDHYQPNQIISRRFNDMVYGGYMFKDGIYFKQTPKGRIAERVYRLTIQVLRLGKY